MARTARVHRPVPVALRAAPAGRLVVRRRVRAQPARASVGRPREAPTSGYTKCTKRKKPLGPARPVIPTAHDPAAKTRARAEGGGGVAVSAVRRARRQEAMRARGRGPDSSVVATPVFFEGRSPAPFCPALLFIQASHEGARSSRSTRPTTICITHLFHFFYFSALPTTTTTPPWTCWTPQTSGVYFRGELSCAAPPLPITGRPRDVFLTLQPSRHTGASRQPTAPASSSFSFPSDAAGAVCSFSSPFDPIPNTPGDTPRIRSI